MAATDPVLHPDASGHERDDVNIRAILKFCLGLLVVAAVVHVLMWWLFEYLASREARKTPALYPLAQTGPQRLPPEPRLQARPLQDLGELRAREEALLHSYAWVDRTAGVVRIPIERAMARVVKRGLPARPESSRETRPEPTVESSAGRMIRR